MKVSLRRGWTRVGCSGGRVLLVKRKGMYRVILSFCRAVTRPRPELDMNCLLPFLREAFDEIAIRPGASAPVGHDS